MKTLAAKGSRARMDGGRGLINDPSRMPAVVTTCCASAAAGIAALVLLSWWFGKWQLGTFGPDYVPMAPSTAWLFILLGGALLVCCRWPSHPATPAFGLLAVSGTVVFCALALSPLAGHTSRILEQAMAGSHTTRAGIPIGQISPVTALAFLGSALALLALLPRWGQPEAFRRVAASLALSVILVSAVMVLGYALGMPILHGTRLVPMALPTAFAFLLLGTGLLFAAGTERWPLRMLLGAHAPAAARPLSRFGWVLTGTLVVIATVIGVAVLCFLHWLDIAARREAKNHLDAVADLKVRQIANWRQERLGDARVLFNTPLIARRISDHLADPSGDDARGDIAGWLESVRQSYDYDRVVLLDAQLRPRLASPPAAGPMAVCSLQLARDAIKQGQVIFSDLHRDSSKDMIHLDLVVPILTRGPAAAAAPSSDPSQPVGVIVLEVNPQKFLYPLIQSWPVPSPTAETLLVRRDGDDALFLNELRHRKNTALTLRIPLSRKEVLAVMAARGQVDTVEGVDYNGSPVLAAIRAVPDSPWFMVAKVDQGEVYASLRQQAWAILGGTGVLMIATCLGVALLWRRREMHFLSVQLEGEQERLAMAERVTLLMRHANDMILLLGEDWRVIEANERALRTYGYTAEEFRRLTLRDLRAPESRADCDEHLRAVNEGKGLTVEAVHQRNDGSTFSVECSLHMVAIEGRRFHQAIIRDITQRKAHEREIERLNRFYAMLSQVNQAIVRARSREELLPAICRVAVEFGRFKAAWIGWLQPDGATLDCAAIHTAGADTDVPVPCQPPICGISSKAIRTGRCCFTNDLAHDERGSACREMAVQLGLHSCAVAPFRFQGRVQGALAVCAQDHDFFNAEEIRLMEEVTSDISYALDRLHDEARRREAESALAIRARQQAVVAEIGRLALTATELQPLLEETVACVADTMGVEYCKVLELLPGGGALKLVAGAGWKAGLVGHATVGAGLDSQAGFTLHSSGPVIVEDLRTEARFNGPPLLRDHGVVSGISVIIHGVDKPFGVLGAHTTRRRTFTQDDVNFFQAVANILADAARRKQAEEEHARLAAAMEQAVEAIVITDTLGTILYVNPAFEKTSGYTRQEAIGQNPRILRSGKHDAAFYKQLWDTLARGEVWHGHFINKKKDGTLYEEDSTISPVRDASGRVVNYVAVKLDVTREAALEADLRQAQKMEVIGRLAGGVAHDFNNLLMAILGYSDMTAKLLDASHPASKNVEEIRAAGQRAAALTRQLLAFSRKQVLQPQVLDLNDLTTNLGKMLRRLIGEHIRLTSILDPALGRVKADPGQIEQVITNLAVNARDAMPDGGTLRIETSNVVLDEAYASQQREVIPGPYVLLAVSDTGTGMTDEVKTHLFEPFFTTKEQGKGTGLGLATVFGIVKQSGGHITAHSDFGHGTTFRIYLPRVDEAAPEPPPAQESPAEFPRGTETILLVEDSDQVRNLAREVLLECGYTVLTAANGAEAAQLARDNPNRFRLLLTDLVLPGMSGRMLAPLLASLNPGIKVLYMSGYTDAQVIREDLVTGGAAFLQKPFLPDVLARKVREVLDAGPGRGHAAKPV